MVCVDQPLIAVKVYNEFGIEKIFYKKVMMNIAICRQRQNQTL